MEFSRAAELSQSVLTTPDDTVVVPSKYSRGKLGPPRIKLIDAEIFQENNISDGFSEKDSLPSQVFRVQLYTSKLYGESTRMSRLARELCLSPVTLDYDVPYYKVRSGAFATRAEADTYVTRVKSLGFAEAWVVIAANPNRSDVVADSVRHDEASPEGEN